MKVAIIGGGISGLTVAHNLQKLGIQYNIFEQTEQPGGNLRSVHIKNYVLEMGPNSLQLTPELKNLISELKLENEILVSKPVAENRFVFRQGHYQQLPDSPLKLVANTFFGLKTKYRIIQERFLPPAPQTHQETVSHFFERRFGKEVADYVVAPYVMGIFGGDASQLLMAKTFPELLKYELEDGSVLKGWLKHKPEKKQTISFKNGLQTLPTALASKLLGLQTGYPVEMITKNQGKFIVSTNSPEYINVEFDVLVLALPAHKATPLLEFTFPGFAAALRNINYPPMAVVHTVYKRSDIGVNLNGFGALHPKIENQFTAGVIWSSSVFDGKCPKDEVLFTSLIGGTPSAENTHKPRLEILKAVHNELKTNYKITAEKPLFQHFHLWSHSIPQFDQFIEDAQEFALKLETENFFVAANWFSGVSVTDCIKRANEVAKKIQVLATTKSG